MFNSSWRWFAAAACAGLRACIVEEAHGVGLAAMGPLPSFASTSHCLANPGTKGEYLVYSPGAGSLWVSVASGTFSVEWLDPSTGNVSRGANVVTGGGQVTFAVPPGLSDAVLYLKGQ